MALSLLGAVLRTPNVRLRPHKALMFVLCDSQLQRMHPIPMHPQWPTPSQPTPVNHCPTAFPCVPVPQVHQEVELHRQLDADCVVPFWAAVDEGPQLHIVLQYCLQRDLRSSLQASGPFSETRVRDQVVIPLLQALSELHAKVGRGTHFRQSWWGQGGSGHSNVPQQLTDPAELPAVSARTSEL